MFFRKPAQKAKGRADVFAAISVIAIAAGVCSITLFQTVFQRA